MLIQIIRTDNIMSKILDPLHLGFSSLMPNVEISVKCIKSTSKTLEKLCIRNGKYDTVKDMKEDT